jgi:hypothetical protein
VRTRRAGRTVGVVAAAGLLVGVVAAPAAAHTIGGGAAASNYRTTVRGVEPAVAGLQARTTAAGDRLELVNRSGQEVLVLGYRPPAVTAAPGQRHVVVPVWQVPLRLGGRTALLEGEVTWVPGPSPWPWALAALAVFAAAMAAARGRHRAGVLAAMALLAVAADVVHTVGSVLGSSAPLAAELNGSATTAAGWAVAGFAAYRLLRGRAESAQVFLLLGGVLLTLAGALPDLAALGRSQLPTAVAPPLARASIAATLGLGAAMVVAGLLGFRSAAPAPEPPEAP